VKITIHPLFFVCGIASALFGGLPAFCICVLTALLHECGHIFYAEKLGYECQKITLMPYGAAALCNIEGITLSDEVKLALAGPLVNAALCVGIVALWWFFPETYAYTDTLLYANLGMLLLNLLPAYPLDGGRILRCLIQKWFGEKASNLVPRLVTGVVAVMGLVGFFVYKNISLLAVSILLFVSAFSKITQANRIKFNSPERLKRGLEVKYVMVNESLTFRQAFKLIEARRYLILQFYGDTFLEELTQDDLYTLSLTHLPTDKVLQ
jgi:stage IV sporulation protein FB